MSPAGAPLFWVGVSFLTWVACGGVFIVEGGSCVGGWGVLFVYFDVRLVVWVCVGRVCIRSILFLILV